MSRTSDFPFQKKQFSVSKKVKFRFDSVSLLAKLNSMRPHYKSKENHEIVIGVPMNINYHWIKI